MLVSRRIRVVSLVGILGTGVGAAACHAAFVPAQIHGNEALFRASLQQYEARKWENAVSGFERLTIELPARDTLFPPTLWYLGRAQAARQEWLLAAQTFSRLAETFPTDTLADRALLEAGRAYGRMWRNPSLDAQYGETALNTYRTLLSIFPTSPLVPTAQREIDRLLDWYAQKSFSAGMHYFRRKAYESSIIYFSDVIAKYPKTPTAREAMLRLAQAYRAINYREDVVETCGMLYRTYPADRRLRDVCGPPPVAARDTAAKP